MAAPGPGAPLVWAPPAPLHHHQHQPSARHVPGPRGAQTVTELGQIAAYDTGSGTAMVRMRGAPARLLGPTRVTACTPRDLTLVGASCLVVLLDQHNPADGVVVAVWPAADGQTDARLTQAGVAEVGVAGTTEASLVAPFPRAYMGAPIVVATASDPAWAATVTGATATGFTLTIRSGAPATGTVAVSWIACGV